MEAGLNIPMIGLAKREEEIIILKPAQSDLIATAKKMGGYVTETTEFISVLLPSNSHIVKLLQRIRDESHRFAVSYHSTLKRQRNSSSILDDIPGVGPATRKKLIRHFGSAKAAITADPSQLQELLGKQTGATIAKYLTSLK